MESALTLEDIKEKTDSDHCQYTAYSGAIYCGKKCVNGSIYCSYHLRIVNKEQEKDFIGNEPQIDLIIVSLLNLLGKTCIECGKNVCGLYEHCYFHSDKDRDWIIGGFSDRTLVDECIQAILIWKKNRGGFPKSENISIENAKTKTNLLKFGCSVYRRKIVHFPKRIWKEANKEIKEFKKERRDCFDICFDLCDIIDSYCGDYLCYHPSFGFYL